MKLWGTHQSQDVLAYEDRGSGPVLVLLHAFPLCRKMFSAASASLSSEYRVLTPDLFGFGDSRLPERGWSVDSQADLLAEWLHCVAPEQPILLGGVSMGGYVALAFARRYALRLRALLLIDTRAEADSPEAQQNRDKAIELVEQSGVQPLLEGMLPKVLGSTTQARRPEVVQQVRELGLSQQPAGVIAGLRALRDRPDARPALGTIRVPTLVIVGSEDTLTPPDVAQSLAEGLPQAELAILPGVGHLPNLEDPTAFERTVRNFLKPHTAQ